MIVKTNKMADSVDPDGLEDAPASALIVTNLSVDFFDDASQKDEFEAAFKMEDSDATFNYLKSFRRARVNFSSTEATVSARLRFHEREVCGQHIKCYFAQVPRVFTEGHLLPPKPEKMFLISPPCSPPVGWEQMPEAEPLLNFELIETLSRMSPGQTHEVQPPSESVPGIVVHICEDPEGFADRPTILQTSRPECN